MRSEESQPPWLHSRRLSHNQSAERQQPEADVNESVENGLGGRSAYIESLKSIFASTKQRLQQTEGELSAMAMAPSGAETAHAAQNNS